MTGDWDCMKRMTVEDDDGEDMTGDKQMEAN